MGIPFDLPPPPLHHDVILDGLQGGGVPLAAGAPGLSSIAPGQGAPAGAIPVPTLPREHVPGDAQCLALWEKYAVPPHIREHSSLVACIATELAKAARVAGYAVHVDEVRASGLLHDLAKAYTIKHRGSHAQLGAAWVVMETGNPRIAQGVAHHVWWPWEPDVRRHFLPMAVIYADKRVAHDQIVTLEERFEDLMARYGTTVEKARGVERSHTQALVIARGFTELLGLDLDACSVDSRRLV